MTQEKQIIGQKLFREKTFTRETVDEEARTVALAFASEEPYERYWGIEVLDVSARSMDLARLVDGAPLLDGHDPSRQIGVVESVEIGQDRVARAIVRFGRSALAEEFFQDVKDGIRRKVSVGYMINEMTLEKKSSDGRPDTYRVTKWTPYEVSIVSIPADNSVGVGRAIETIAEKEVLNMADEVVTAPVTVAAPAVDTTALRSAGVAEERARTAEINAVAVQFPQLRAMADAAVSNGTPIQAFKDAALAELSKKSGPTPSAEIGLNDKEVRSFSVARLINAMVNPMDQKAQRDASFELAAAFAAKEHAEKNGRSVRGFMIPADVIGTDKTRAERVMTVGTNSAGGYTVATDLRSDMFIDLLRNKMALQGLGITAMAGLEGFVPVPRKLTGATGYWIAENGTTTASQVTLGQIALSPKTVTAQTVISRRLLMQSSLNMDAFINNELSTVLALAIDLAGITGSGASNQPTGILSTAGIGSVAGGTNGAAVAWSHIVDLEAAVANNNALLGSMGYLTNTTQVGKMKKTNVVSGQNGFIWDSANGSDAPLNGYQCRVSNQVPSNLTKGTTTNGCSAIIFGNWSDLVLGMWGGLDIVTQQSTSDASVTVSVFQDVDYAVRNAASFAAMVDALNA